jgi:folate-binding protein YgfZ
MTLCCAILDDVGQGRALLRLRGPDARRFLQGTVSGNLDELSPTQAVAAALLTVKGKIVAELVVLQSSDTLDVLVPRSEADAVARSFEEHIIMDDVTVERADEIGAAIVWDDEGVDPDLATDGLIVVGTRHPLPATLVVGPMTTLRAALGDAEAVDAAGFDRARIESGTPGWGAELRAGYFPPEVGFVYAVAYDKGCFLGQEPLARIHARGQVNRVMVRVVAESFVATPVDVRAETRDDAGTLTTCVGEISGAGGLAIVRREFAVAGTLLRTATEPPVALRVVSGPIGDDPGVRGR